MASQCEMLLDLLKVRGDRGVTWPDALADVGTARLAARIKDLRDEGENIETRHVKTARGATVACYVWHPPADAPQRFVELGLGL